MKQHPPLKCRFRHSLITRTFACELAHEIADRNGPGILCQQQKSHEHCCLLFDTLKAVALPVLGVPDDLAVMPASVITKIQCGGLIALSETIGKHEPSTNINALVESVFETYEDFNDLDFGPVVKAIMNYKLRKRRKK